MRNSACDMHRLTALSGDGDDVMPAEDCMVCLIELNARQGSIESEAL